VTSSFFGAPRPHESATDDLLGRTRGSAAWIAAVALFVALLVAYPLRPARLLPLSPTTEDAYYLLTVSRNIAGGHGISYDGIRPTNGVQPAAAAVFALPYLASPGDPFILPLRLVQLLQVGFFLVGAVLCGRLAEEMSAGVPRATARRAGVLLWLGSYAVFRHAVNGMETGLYLVCLQAWLLWQLRHEAEAHRARTALVSGLLLGLAVLARIDAAFLVVGACLVALLPVGAGAATPRRRRVFAAALTAAGALAVSAPWWIRSQVLFGDLMPSSGHAESLTVPLGANLERLLPSLAQGLSPVLPPVAMRFSWMGAAATLAALVVAWLVLLRIARADPSRPRVIRWRRPAMAFMAAGIGWACYYCGWFGAPHFVERYLIPLAVPLVPLTAAIAAGAVHALPPHGPRRVAFTLVAALLFFGAALEHAVTLTASPWISGNPFYTFQFKRLAARLPAAALVGALQSGTLGYFRIGSVNLDGKVNTDALRARKSGTLWRYVRERHLDYLVDWPGDVARMLGPDSARRDYVKLDEAGGFELWGRRSDHLAPTVTGK
jgi:hypothetical protein